MEKTVLIISTGSFPYGPPRAIRLRAFMQIFEAIGWRVCVYSDDITGKDVGKEKTKFGNSTLYSLGSQKVKLEKINIPFEFKKKLSEIVQLENPRLIFSVCAYDRFSIITRCCKKYKIPLIIDSNEWYDPSTFRWGRLSWHYICHCICWRWFYPKANGAVVISRLLEKHYKNLIANVIRIPTIVPELDDDYTIALNEDGKIRLLFAGSLARTKDSIKPYFEALNYLKKHKDCIQFEICGVSKNELEMHLGKQLYEKYKKQVHVYGRIPQEKIKEMYLRCNYGIFFRPDQRSSHAGFSTKLGEGMSTGTPFIINDTSDISLYIKSGKNGFIVKDRKDIAIVYEKLINMSMEEQQEMRFCARKTAETDFYYVSYIEAFKEFLEKIVDGEKNCE